MEALLSGCLSRGFQQEDPHLIFIMMTVRRPKSSQRRVSDDGGSNHCTVCSSCVLLQLSCLQVAVL